MKNKRFWAAVPALALALCACTNTPESRGLIDDDRKDPTPAPTQAAETPTPTETPEPVVDLSLYEEMANWSYVFSSGAGGWATELTVNPDGSFKGEYYDYDMGVTGPGYPNGSKYECIFNGHFSTYTETAPYIYKVTIGDIKYEHTPGTEETKDDMHYIYTDPYGIGSSKELMVYLPGAPVKDLPEGYLSWVGYDNFNSTKNGLWDKDYPEDLPMCGIYNEADDTGFDSTNISGVNKNYLVNSTALPGLKNIRSEIHSDNTYYFEDMSEDGTIKISNICFITDKHYLTYANATAQAEFADLCLKQLFSSASSDDLTIYGYGDGDNPIASTHIMVNGRDALFALWLEGSNEDTRYNMGIFTESRMAWDSTVPGYGYAYVISVSPDYCIYDYGTLDKYLLSLTFSGLQDKLSSASENDVCQSGYYSVKPGSGNGKILMQELELIYLDETDKLKQYGLSTDPNDYMNDYTFGEVTDYFEYNISDDCPIYFVYMENVFTQPLDIKDFATWSEDDPDGGLMQVYFDSNGEIVLMSAPDPY